MDIIFNFKSILTILGFILMKLAFDKANEN